MKILLFIPPFTQINSPYPATCQLAGFLKSRGHQAASFDLSLVVFLKIFSKSGLRQVFAQAGKREFKDSGIHRTLGLAENYIDLIDLVIQFLQNKNPNLAYALIKDHFLPVGKSFPHDINEHVAFGNCGIQDKAKYYCSLLLDDLTDFIQKTITPHFGLSRYAEKLAITPSSFTPLLNELQRPLNLIEEIIIEETEKIIHEHRPDYAGYSIPFPGNLLGALVSSRFIKEKFPAITVVYGGGYINTELRQLQDPAIFDYTDYLTYDDGELPLLNILENRSQWVRTLRRFKGQPEFLDNASTKDVAHKDLPSPSMDGIHPDHYLALTEMLNPMHRLWSDGYWNKLMLAHGCYWHQCTFCDTTLDYIQRYAPARASTIVDWMENLIQQTGRNAFHFTDEAAPPALLKEMALEILYRKLKVSWWGNIRFEKAFTTDVCRLLSRSGCVAVSGGLEVAEERLLKLIHKGVTLQQAALSCHNFRNAGIMVHAYLMYGFPTQTGQEIIDSLEVVRQFMQMDLIQSGFWHRFALTSHSLIARNPSDYQIKIISSRQNPFANNELHYQDLTGMDYQRYSAGLNKALYNYMHGNGLSWGLNRWFDFKIPQPTIPHDLIKRYLNASAGLKTMNDHDQIIWLGRTPLIESTRKQKCHIIVQTNNAEFEWEMDKPTAQWLKNLAAFAQPSSDTKPDFRTLKQNFPGSEPGFALFEKTEIWQELREHLLLGV